MAILSVFNMPSLEETFGSNPAVLDLLNKAGFTSVAPLMLLPRPALIGVSAGQHRKIDHRSATKVSQQLSKRGLKQHDLNEPMAKFIDEQFGCIDDAPISIMQVTIMRNAHANLPVFAPLEVVGLLEDIEPHMTMLDLVRMTRHEVRDMVEERAAFGLRIHNLHEDLKHLALRLGNFDLSFTPKRIATLHRAVNE